MKPGKAFPSQRATSSPYNNWAEAKLLRKPSKGIDQALQSSAMILNTNPFISLGCRQLTSQMNILCVGWQGCICFLKTFNCSNAVITETNSESPAVQKTQMARKYYSQIMLQDSLPFLITPSNLCIGVTVAKSAPSYRKN